MIHSFRAWDGEKIPPGGEKSKKFKGKAGEGARIKDQYEHAA